MSSSGIGWLDGGDVAVRLFLDREIIVIVSLTEFITSQQHGGYNTNNAGGYGQANPYAQHSANRYDQGAGNSFDQQGSDPYSDSANSQGTHGGGGYGEISGTQRHSYTIDKVP